MRRSSLLRFVEAPRKKTTRKENERECTIKLCTYETLICVKTTCFLISSPSVVRFVKCLSRLKLYQSVIPRRVAVNVAESNKKVNEVRTRIMSGIRGSLTLITDYHSTSQSHSSQPLSTNPNSTSKRRKDYQYPTLIFSKERQTIIQSLTLCKGFLI